MSTRIISLFSAAVLVTSVAACHRNPKPAGGPMERAGRHVDNAAEKTKEVTKDAAKDTKDAAKDIKNDVKRDVK